MKRKKRNWDTVPWSEFKPGTVPPGTPDSISPHAIWINSRYQVSVWYDGIGTFGPLVHLSIKTHDKQARHDWRDMQRIKNEIVGPEVEAVELYPAESRLTDTANQYHLYCFPTFKFPFGYKERLVSEASWGVPGMRSARQRPFPDDAKPTDLADHDELQRRYEQIVNDEADKA